MTINYEKGPYEYKSTGRDAAGTGYMLIDPYASKKAENNTLE